MKVLQIANDFSGSQVHCQLFKKLDCNGVEQIIYSPVREKNKIGKNCFNGNCSTIVYSYVIKPYHRYLYHIKRNTLLKDLLSLIDIKVIDICHAATLFSDGGLAYKLYKKYNIPYVVAVRNTDINGFMNLLPHTWLYGIKILLNAQKIFFISEGLKQKFQNHFIIRPILKRIQKKCVLVPNGIDNYFLDNINTSVCHENKIIYVGDFSNNKNVIRLCNAVLRLRQDKDFEDTTLTIVGGGKNTTNNVEKLISANHNVFNYVGKVYDKEKLCRLFRSSSIFAMPSIHETFGLVYIEALSQNLPVLYTKGQGIDGLFSSAIGIGVNPLSEEEIYNSIKQMLSHRDDYSNKDVNFEIFRWANIADRYIKYYKDILYK